MSEVDAYVFFMGLYDRFFSKMDDFISILPFYLYVKHFRARPLPPHVPEPAEVIPVSLDEQTLQGEPLFPKGLFINTLSKTSFRANTTMVDGKSRTQK